MNLLEINNLHTYFDTRRGTIKAVNGISFNVKEGKTLGVVGESGSGKSQTAMSILRLFENNQRIAEGEIKFEGKVINNLSENALRKIRGNDISMIFQEPMSSLNPVFTVERQINEVLILHQNMTKKQASKKTKEMLEQVQITNPEAVMKQYPHQLSGGMCQRVMIAMALACNPKLLIADEPTTALDVIIQAEILKLMNELKNDYNTSIMFITHDLGVISEMADDVIVMHRGKIVESGSLYSIFDYPTHPYTKRLMAAFLKTDISSRKDEQELEQDLFSEENEIFDFQNFRENNEADDDWYEVAPDHFVACRVL
ncbi:MAG: ABC transporter ATP-binding protein [Erysipelothrix sp.]|nr:ABC transporter ATP-binding protein [Erysipelothrix sp.]